MHSQRFELDPQGDTLLVLRNPNTQNPVCDPPQNKQRKLKRKKKAPREPLPEPAESATESDVPKVAQSVMEPAADNAEGVPSSTHEPAEPRKDDIQDGRLASPELHQDSSERTEMQFRLSSRHLSLTSPVFKAMLNGP